MNSRRPRHRLSHRAFLAAAALLAGGVWMASAQEPAGAAGEIDGAADDSATRFVVPVDAPATRALDLSRAETDERIIYDVTIDVPGRKIPLTARVPLEAGQSGATLTLSVQEREGRRISSLALPAAPDGTPGDTPRLRLGLRSGTPTEVSLVRADASQAASYHLEATNGEDGNFSFSDDTLDFAEGQTEAYFNVTANPSRLETLELRITRADDAGDRLRLSFPIVRSALAAFENNFYVCFIKKIPFGTREVRTVGPDGAETVRTETIYKGRWHYITNGLKNTLSVALCAVLLGAVIGFFLAVIRSTHDKHGRLTLLNAFAKLYITVIRGTPMTVQLLIAYFIIFSNLNNKVLVAILAFGFNSGAYVAEIIRAGIVSIDEGQMEAARSLGLSYTQGMCRIVLPQAIRNVLPALGNEFIVMLKDTSIASFIGLDDLARGGSIIRSQTYQAYIPFLAVAAIYLILVMIFSKLLTRLEKQLHNTGTEEA